MFYSLGVCIPSTDDIIPMLLLELCEVNVLIFEQIVTVDSLCSFLNMLLMIKTQKQICIDSRFLGKLGKISSQKRRKIQEDGLPRTEF